MFEREAFVKDIAMNLTLGKGYHDLEIEWVNADPVRFAQVLLNFISNAVRFTEKRETRVIEVILDASETEPTLLQPLVGTNEMSPSRVEKPPVEIGPPIFLIASVADSGVGLTQEEQRNLFHKFAQASPKTHIEYGGSGLGLFISRALVEVQGGRISLESEKDKGTTLTFYISARKVSPPSTPPEQIALPTISKQVSPRAVMPKIKRNMSSTSTVIRTKTVNVLVVEDNLVCQCGRSDLDQSKITDQAIGAGRISSRRRESRWRVSGETRRGNLRYCPYGPRDASSGWFLRCS
jgi:hypothetical protein